LAIDGLPKCGLYASSSSSVLKEFFKETVVRILLLWSPEMSKEEFEGPEVLMLLTSILLISSTF
jgi:predicted secreted protein